ncbi:protein of unknown function [Legionella fallonii LLAP-10]|uniref:Uncharacterized protein n=1 Tax=Legionella fallonii LLAP-10 TaxID=1212491 RepID=A0A098G656_9GAMM|nr:protein of unknown function [Legionella fallonii LLAP-10]
MNTGIITQDIVKIRAQYTLYCYKYPLLNHFEQGFVNYPYENKIKNNYVILQFPQQI